MRNTALAITVYNKENKQEEKKILAQIFHLPMKKCAVKYCLTIRFSEDR
jgi:hypothetical protein